MTPLFRSRQAAEELHAAVTGEAPAEVRERHGDLLRTVALLQDHRPVQPRPEFLLDLRAQLLLAAQTDLVAAPRADRVPLTAAPSRGHRRLGTVAASLVIVGGTAGMAAAAQGSLPGDPLYPLKRGGEQVQTFVAVGEAAEGRALLGQAAERLEEAQALQDSGAGPDRVVAAVEEFRTTTDAGARRLFVAYQSGAEDDDVRAVNDFGATQSPLLDALASDADPVAEPAIREASDTLTAVLLEAARVCSGCGTAPLPTLGAAGPAASTSSLDSLLTRPAQQAGMDARALDRLSRSDQQQLLDLSRAAEDEADRTPAAGEEAPGDAPGDAPGGTLPPAVGDWPVSEEASLRGPVESTLTAVGGGVRRTVDGSTRAVDDLVVGLDRTVGDTLGRVRTGTPLDAPVSGLTDTVDDAVEGVTDLTGRLSGR